jgi:hypothetical protein
MEIKIPMAAPIINKNTAITTTNSIIVKPFDFMINF